MLQTAVELLEDGLAILKRNGVDGEYRWVYINPAFAELVGCSAENLLGNPFQDIASSGMDEGVVRCLLDIDHTSPQTRVEVVTGQIAGIPRIVSVQSSPLDASSENQTGRALILRDVSMKHRANESVWNNERLVGIGLLASGIAHEINNPLGSTLLAAETALAIKDSPAMAEQLTACLNNIVASTDRCGRIVRTLLRYSRDEPSEQQCCSINDVAKQAIDITRSYAERSQVIVRLERSADVSLAPMNPLEIEMVLVNLIHNAVQASGKNTEILVRTEPHEKSVCASVSDHGCGMTPDQITHMFDPMFTTRKSDGGFGLGLAIAAGIVQRHQGYMEVQSHPGQGTTIFVRLPLATDSPP
jgi:PAS domain S-box-containing protein